MLGLGQACRLRVGLQTLRQARSCAVCPVAARHFPTGKADGVAFGPRRGLETRFIDLNADCGEGYGDAGLLKYVTSVNIACGGHISTTESIARALAASK